VNCRWRVAITSAGAILEVGGGGSSVGIKRAIEGGVAGRNPAGELRDNARRDGRSGKRGVGPGAAADGVRGDEVKAIDRAWEQATDGAIDGEGIDASAESHSRCVGSVTGVRAILEAGGGGGS